MRLAVAAAVVVGAAGAACADRSADVEPPELQCGVTGVAPAGASVALYFDVVSERDDRIVAAGSSAATRATLHQLEVLDGGGVMRPVDAIDVNVGRTRLGGVTNHVMLERLSVPLGPGDDVVVELTFEEQGTTSFEATVLTNDELRTALDRPCGD